MPDFPRYNSKATPTTQQPSVQAPTDNTGEVVAQAGEKIGSAIQTNTLKWSNAVDTIQKTTSQANFKAGMLDIQTRAANDPNYNNSDQYFKEIEKLKSESLKGFSSKTAETEMAIDLDYESKVGQFAIDGLYKKKMIDVGQASTYKLLDMESQRGSENLEQRISGVLDSQVKAGIFSHEDAYKIQKEYVKKGKYNSFLSDLSSNPALTDDNLSKNVYGFDVKELRDAKSIYQTESQKIQAVTENSVIEAYLNNEDVTVDSIKGLLQDKKIDAKFAESMINKLSDPKPDQMSQDKAYIDFTNRGAEAMEKGDKAEIGEIVKLMSETMEAHSKGLLDKADVTRILKDRNALLQTKLEGKAEEIMSQVRPKKLLQRLSFWTDEYADKKPEIKARMYRKLIDGITQGADEDLLLSKIVDDEIDIQMENNLKTPDRQYANNPETKERAYSDDGGHTWFDEKTGKEIK